MAARRTAAWGARGRSKLVVKDRRGLPKKATLQAVADAAEVSKATASMILSGRSNYLALFSRETVRKVNRIAESLGYRTNVFASSLGTSRTPFFSLIIAGSDPENEFAYDAFESLMVSGVLGVSSSAGTYPIVLTTGDLDPAEMKSVDDIICGGVFGTIARTPSPHIEAKLLEQLGRHQPVAVVFPRSLSKWRSNAIDTDNEAMGSMAGEIFARNGLKKWALVCFTATSPSHEARAKGLAQAARRFNAKLQIIRLDTDPLHLDGLPEVVIPRLLRAKPQAVLGANTAASVSSVIGVARMGLEAGKDISIIGVDCPLYAEDSWARYSITSLSVSWKAAGRTAMNKLLEARTSGEGRFPNVIMAPTLRVGQTCAVPEDLIKPASK
jgi:LacI family transcriptional regulator